MRTGIPALDHLTPLLGKDGLVHLVFTTRDGNAIGLWPRGICDLTIADTRVDAGRPVECLRCLALEGFVR